MFWRVPQTDHELLCLLEVLGALCCQGLDVPVGLAHWMDVQPRKVFRHWIQLVHQQGETEYAYQGLLVAIETCQPELLVEAEALDAQP